MKLNREEMWIVELAEEIDVIKLNFILTMDRLESEDVLFTLIDFMENKMIIRAVARYLLEKMPTLKTADDYVNFNDIILTSVAKHNGYYILNKESEEFLDFYINFLTKEN